MNFVNKTRNNVRNRAEAIKNGQIRSSRCTQTCRTLLAGNTYVVYTFAINSHIALAASGAHARIMYSVCYSDRHAGKPGTICSAAMSREYLEAENLKPGKTMAEAWQSTQVYRIGNEIIFEEAVLIVKSPATSRA